MARSPDEFMDDILKDDYPDEYDNVPTYESLSDEERDEFMSLEATMHMLFDLFDGTLPSDGTTIVKAYPGKTESEALGRAYHLRDELEDGGVSTTVEYIEPAYRLENTIYHRIEITVTAE